MLNFKTSALRFGHTHLCLVFDVERPCQIFKPAFGEFWNRESGRRFWFFRLCFGCFGHPLLPKIELVADKIHKGVLYRDNERPAIDLVEGKSGTKNGCRKREHYCNKKR